MKGQERHRGIALFAARYAASRMTKDLTREEWDTLVCGKDNYRRKSVYLEVVLKMAKKAGLVEIVRVKGTIYIRRKGQ